MTNPEDVTPAQIRAARALLGWGQTDLASAADVGITTLRTFEGGQRQPIRAIKAALVRALEKEGIEFLNESKRSGVSLTSARHSKHATRPARKLAQTA